MTDDEITVKPLTSREAAVAVFEALFRLDTRNRSQLEAELDFAATFGASARLHRLCYPHDYRLLPDVIQAVTQPDTR